MPTIVRNEAGRTAAPWRSTGVWLALAASLYLLVNVVRAIIDPGGFAEYLGLALSAEGDTAWVLVYASRTAFVAAVALYLLGRGQLHTLAVVAVVAVVMPVSDALLTLRAEAGPAVVLRHVAIALVLLLTAALLESRHRRHR